jgi:hypothetical protein
VCRPDDRSRGAAHAQQSALTRSGTSPWTGGLQRKLEGTPTCPMEDGGVAGSQTYAPLIGRTRSKGLSEWVHLLALTKDAGAMEKGGAARLRRKQSRSQRAPQLERLPSRRHSQVSSEQLSGSVRGWGEEGVAFGFCSGWRKIKSQPVQWYMCVICILVGG